MPVQLNGADLITSFGDYEEGTWTPTLQDDSRSNSESQVNAEEFGTYTKIGDTVFLRFRLAMATLGCLDGCQGAVIAGLPFTSNSTTGRNVAGPLIGLLLAITAGTAGSVRLLANDTVLKVYLWDATAGVTVLTITEVSSNGVFEGTIQYQV